MKLVTMVVEFVVRVPDDTDVEDLVLDLDTDQVTVETVTGGPVKSAYVSSYETKNTLED